MTLNLPATHLYLGQCIELNTQRAHNLDGRLIYMYLSRHRRPFSPSSIANFQISSPFSPFPHIFFLTCLPNTACLSATQLHLGQCSELNQTTSTCLRCGRSTERKCKLCTDSGQISIDPVWLRFAGHCAAITY